MKVVIKTAFPVSAVWFGALVGPSMVSGAYAAVYFAPYGTWGLILPFIAMFCICVVVALAANIVRQNKSYDYNSFAKVIYGKYSKFLTPLLELFIILAMVLGGSAVLSMSGTLFHNLFAIPPVWGAIFMATLSIILVLWGERLIRISSVLMTIILLIGFVIVAVFSVRYSPDGLNVVITDWDVHREPRLAIGIVNSILLGFSNLGMVTTLCSVEQNITKPSQCIAIAVISFLLNSLAFGVSTLMILPYCPDILQSSIPAQYIIQGYIAEAHPISSGLYAAIMFFALLSSGAPQLHAVSTRIIKLFSNTEKKRTRMLYNLVIGLFYMGLCTIISFFGLYAIISTGYSSLAKLGIPLIAVPVVIYAVRPLIQQRIKVNE